jgi:hypothetical protein
MSRSLGGIVHSWRSSSIEDKYLKKLIEVEDEGLKEEKRPTASSVKVGAGEALREDDCMERLLGTKERSR